MTLLSPGLLHLCVNTASAQQKGIWDAMNPAPIAAPHPNSAADSIPAVPKHHEHQVRPKGKPLTLPQGSWHPQPMLSQPPSSVSQPAARQPQGCVPLHPQHPPQSSSADSDTQYAVPNWTASRQPQQAQQQQQQYLKPPKPTRHMSASVAASGDPATAPQQGELLALFSEYPRPSQGVNAQPCSPARPQPMTGLQANLRGLAPEPTVNIMQELASRGRGTPIQLVRVTQA